MPIAKQAYIVKHPVKHFEFCLKVVGEVLKRKKARL